MNHLNHLQGEQLWSFSFLNMAVSTRNIHLFFFFFSLQDLASKQGTGLLGFRQFREVQSHSFQRTQAQINSFYFGASAYMPLALAR